METSKEFNDPGAAHVPAQQTGSQMNAVEKLVLASDADAVHLFSVAKERLLDVKRWTEIAGGGIVM